MRLRSLIVFSVALFFLASCSKEKRFTIVGDFKNLPQQKILLEELRVTDSITVVDSTRADAQGKFELTGEAAEPGLYRVHFEHGYIMLSLQSGTVHISGDYRTLPVYTVQGSAASGSLQEFLRGVSSHMRDLNSYDDAMRQLHQQGRDSVIPSAQEEAQKVADDLTRNVERYADSTAYLPNALFAVRVLNPLAEQQFIETFLQTLPKRFGNAPQAAEFTDRWHKMLAQQTGQEQQQQQFTGGPVMGALAPSISLPTPEGNAVSLASLKGKYVLVDFWASWCVPCRHENPNVVAAYAKYKDKDFTILGVSLDNDKDKWTGAIKADGLAWTHVSDLKGWESIAARDYGVQSIPTNFLLDKDGKIVARDLRGPALEAKLAQLLK